MSDNNNDSSVLSINVAEDITMTDVGLGGGAPVQQKSLSAEEILRVIAEETVKATEVPPGTSAEDAKRLKDENLPKEELEKRQKIMLEYTRLSSRYVNPHNKKSRWVTEADIPKILADGADLVAMCNLPRGRYSGIAALSHPQMDDQDPLRFFIFPNGMIVINPVITSHTQAPIFKDEGCMSFPDNDVKKMVERYNKITVTYQTLNKKEGQEGPCLSLPITETMTGGTSHVFQHEVSHLNGCNIYDDNYDPKSSIMFWDETNKTEEEVQNMYEYDKTLTAPNK